MTCLILFVCFYTNINICDALRNSDTITPAAKSLGCRRAYIHQELAKVGTTPQDVIKGSLNMDQESPSKNHD